MVTFCLAFPKGLSAYVELHEYIKYIKQNRDQINNTFARNATGIINAIKNGKSNASAERMNGNIQLLKANARGYSCFENFRTAILFYHGNLDLYP